MFPAMFLAIFIVMFPVVPVYQNDHDKGTQVVQAAGNGQNEKNNHKGNDSMEPKIPPPIKVSSNFDLHRSNLQKNNQNNSQHYQNRPPINSSLNKNNSTQILDPSAPIVTRSLASQIRANQNVPPINITPPIISTRQGFLP